MLGLKLIHASKRVPGCVWHSHGIICEWLKNKQLFSKKPVQCWLSHSCKKIMPIHAIFVSVREMKGNHILPINSDHFIITHKASFWPSGMVIARVCMCVCACVCVKPEPVHPFELGSPNLDRMCKRLWLRSCCIVGDWPWSSKSNEYKNKKLLSEH